MRVRLMNDVDMKGKTVVFREDLNVPVKDGRITSDKRIRAAIPSLKYALDRGAAVIVLSHLGRPEEGVFSAEDSLAPVAARLGELLDSPVPLVRDYLDGVDARPGRCVLCEKELPRTCRETRRAGRHICHGRVRHSPQGAGLHGRGHPRRQNGLRRLAHGGGAGRGDPHSARTCPAASGDHRRIQGVDKA